MQSTLPRNCWNSLLESELGSSDLFSSTSVGGTSFVFEPCAEFRASHEFCDSRSDPTYDVNAAPSTEHQSNMSDDRS